MPAWTMAAATVRAITTGSQRIPRTQASYGSTANMRRPRIRGARGLGHRSSRYHPHKLAERVGFEPKVVFASYSQTRSSWRPREKRPSKKLTDCFPDQRDSYAQLQSTPAPNFDAPGGLGWDPLCGVPIEVVDARTCYWKKRGK